MTERIADLLVRAARLLPREEQDELLAALLRTTVAGNPVAGLTPASGAAVEPFGGTGPAAGPPVSGRITMDLSADVASRQSGGRGPAGRAQAFGTRRPLGPLRGLPDGHPSAEEGLKVLPVRLPAGDYERLRTFSRDHGFTMAVIVRTLVERFLDAQARRSAQREDLEDDPEVQAHGHA